MEPTNKKKAVSKVRSEVKKVSTTRREIDKRPSEEKYRSPEFDKQL